MALFKKTKQKKEEDIKENKKNNAKKGFFRKNNKETLKDNSDLKVDIENDKGTTLFEENMKSLKDLIAPDSLDFAESPRYSVMGDRYYLKNLYIGLLPNQANFASFLHELYNFGTIDTSIHIQPVNNQDAISDLSKLRTSLEMEYIGSTGSNRAEDMAVKVQEAQRLRSEIRDGYNRIYEVSVISTLYENNLRSLNNATDQLKETLGQKDIGLKSAIFCQEEAFVSNKPFNKNVLGEWHTFDKRSLACTFPFTSSNINHPDGVPIGFNMDNGLPVMYDSFDENLRNYNMVIFATSGGGKSTFIKMLSARTSTLDNVQNIFIDIEPEYRDICEILGGTNILISSNKYSGINPFEIVVDAVKNTTTGIIEDKILLKEKINSITALLLTMAKGSIPNNPYYDDVLKMIIKRTVQKVYSDLEITEDKESLYVYEEERIVDEKIVGGKKKKPIPNMSTFYQTLKACEKEYNNQTYRKYYDYLMLQMSDFCKITNGGFIAFDSYGCKEEENLKLGYDIPFINFDVSELNEDKELPLAQHIITDFIWETMVKRNSGGHKIRVGIDEAWRMVKYPEALEFLVNLFRRGRKKNTQTVVISQQFNEFYKEDTDAIIKNADTKLFLPPDATSVDNIKEVFKLTEGQTEFLRTSQTGEGLLIINNMSVKLKIDIPDFEMDFVQTNQNATKKAS